MNAADVVLRHATRLGDKIALVHYDAAGAREDVSYRDLAARVQRVAAALRSRGIALGERVALLLDDSPRFCAAFLGIAKAGGIAIPLNTRLMSSDYRFILEDSQARWIIVDAAYEPMLREAAAGTAATIIPALPFDTECAACPADAPTPGTTPADAAFWLYSSGTTGNPKAIIHTHANLALAGKLLREVAQADETWTIYSTSRLFFAFPLDNAFLGVLAIGATTVLNTAWPEVEVVLSQVERHRPSAFFSVPSFFRRLLALGDARLAPFRTARVCYTGGERVPESVFALWQVATGVPLLSCYGMSETFLNAIAESPGNPRAGSCGRPLPGVETRLVAMEGTAPAPGEPGVLWLRHPALATGYLHAEPTRKAFRDGWFCTNDLFSVDADGYWWHQGRADELLKVAGQWVRPGEVEEAALAAPGVREAACVVVPDAEGFERLALFVVPVAGTVDVFDAVGQLIATRLPRHSRPKWIRAVAELPRTPTGKVQRFRLRESFLDEARHGR